MSKTVFYFEPNRNNFQTWSDLLNSDDINLLILILIFVSYSPTPVTKTSPNACPIEVNWNFTWPMTLDDLDRPRPQCLFLACSPYVKYCLSLSLSLHRSNSIWPDLWSRMTLHFRSWAILFRTPVTSRCMPDLPRNKLHLQQIEEYIVLKEGQVPFGSFREKWQNRILFIIAGNGLQWP